MCDRGQTLPVQGFFNTYKTVVAYLLLLECIVIKTTIDILVYSLWIGKGQAETLLNVRSRFFLQIQMIH